MKPIQFTKGHGTGNDFVLIFDAQYEINLNQKIISEICNRHFGVGADGLIRIVRSEFIEEGRVLLEEEPNAIWFMDYYNADGLTAEMCGNGIRVMARYLIDRGHASIPEGSSLPIATRSGIRDLTRSSNGFAVDLGKWELTSEALVEADGLAVPRPAQGVSVGNPHFVVALASDSELSSLNLESVPKIEPEPSAGANVEFVLPEDPLVKSGVGRIHMRVHERGVGETLSCGTGVAAAALATRNWAGPGAPNHWQVTVPGGTLGVRIFPTEEGEHVGLSGPAELVFEGTFSLP